jgi:RecA/RadA recombinase
LEAAEASQAAESAPRAYSLSPLSGSVPGIIGRLLNPTRQTIPTPSREMNEMLNGGWTLQRVYLIGGGSGEGKTTFCAWASDFAASQNIPAVFVSFQARKELLSVYALARTAKIDSAKIERGLCGEGRSQQSEELRKTLMRAGREYFRTGDYLHVLEADCNTTVSDVQDAVTATRKHFGLEETDPVLVVVDSLREILPDGASEESRKPGRQRIARALLQLKELAQSRNAAVVVTLDTPSAAHTRFGVLSADTQEFETTAGVADTCFVLESHTSRVRSDSEESGLRKRPHTRLQDPLDRLLEDLAHHPVLSRKVQDIRREYVLDEESAATYCRLVPLKNRGGKTNVQPLFVYRRAYHDFEPIPTDLSQAGE